jgi:thioredoxin 1
MMFVTELNSENFDDRIKKGVVIVDIKAEWCSPCKALSPILDQVAGELGDKVLVGKLDADQNGDLCQRLEVRNIPTLLFYKDGELKERTVGMKQKKEILNIVNNLLTQEIETTF